MADIKITLSQDKTVFAGDIDLENNFLKDKKSLWYPLCKGKPRNVDAGDWVYFILKNQVVGRAKIAKLEFPEDTILKTYKNKNISKNRWGIRINQDKIEKPKMEILHRGFPGFRYLTASEITRFEKVFK